MVKKACVTGFMLVLTAFLAYLLPRALEEETRVTPSIPVIRVWSGEQDSAVNKWLKKRGAAYEKETGARVYLRLASKEELESVQGRDSEIAPPDLIVSPAGQTVIAKRGYALILRDESVAKVTPLPTGALFIRPSPTPGPSAAPSPAVDYAALPAALAPRELKDTLPGVLESASPYSAFLQGQAQAALLTAAQAEQLPFGYRAYAVPEGKGLLNVGAESQSDAGAAFLSFLLTIPSQQALREVQLYSPVILLYSPEDDLRFLIDSSRS